MESEQRKRWYYRFEDLLNRLVPVRTPEIPPADYVYSKHQSSNKIRNKQSTQTFLIWKKKQPGPIEATDA